MAERHIQEIQQAARLLERRIAKADRRRPSGLERRAPFIRDLNLQIRAKYEGRLEVLRWVLGDNNGMTELYSDLIQESLQSANTKKRE